MEKFNSPEYSDQDKIIEQIRHLENTSDKMLFVLKQDFEYKQSHEGDAIEGMVGNGIFDKRSVFFNKEIKDEIIGELKANIQTAEELDVFLSELMAKVNQFFDSNEGLSKQNRGLLLGHGVNKILVSTILNPAFMSEGHDNIYNDDHIFTEDDLDWWYALGKNLYFNNIVDFALRSFVYKNNSSHPKSMIMKEYLLSKGIDIEK